MSGIGNKIKREIEEDEIWLLRWLEKHLKHVFHLNIHFHTKNLNKMGLNTLTLTDLNVHTGVVTVSDNQTPANLYTGTLSNIQVSDSDTTQDTAVSDPSVANTIDVQAVSNTGGSLVNIKADFTSQGNASPAPGSTAIAVPDGTVFTGLTGQATLINQIPVTPPAPTLNLNINF